MHCRYGCISALRACVADGFLQRNHKKQQDMKVCIFCSANADIDPFFFEATRELAQMLAKNSHSIVFGGCNMGLMECVAEAARSAGAQTIGVIPTKVEEHGKVSGNVDVEIMCDNLNDRKALMMAQSDIFIALPGGIGTLDEIFTVAASATIGYHAKKVLLYNMKGFWNPLTDMLEKLAAQNMVRGNWRDYIVVVNNIDEIGSFLK